MKESLLQIPEKESKAMAVAVEIVKRVSMVGEEHMIMEALTSMVFWILFVLLLFG